MTMPPMLCATGAWPDVHFREAVLAAPVPDAPEGPEHAQGSLEIRKRLLHRQVSLVVPASLHRQSGMALVF